MGQLAPDHSESRDDQLVQRVPFGVKVLCGDPLQGALRARERMPWRRFLHVRHPVRLHVQGVDIHQQVDLAAFLHQRVLDLNGADQARRFRFLAMKDLDPIPSGRDGPALAQTKGELRSAVEGQFIVQ